MESFLKNFESLGDNCEFGFFLQEQEMNETSLFRWAAIVDYASVAPAIEARFDGIYQLRNLVPQTDSLVRDLAFGGIAFHTDMPIIEHDGMLKFATSEEDRSELHAKEQSKFRYLAEKFRLVLEHESRIYVVKQEYVPAETDDATSLLETLRRHGDASVLQVVVTTKARNVGKVKRIAPHHYIGYIDRFAGAQFPHSINFDAWATICSNAWSLHSASTRGLRGWISHFSKSLGASDDSLTTDDYVPKWFDPQLYLRANPDVAAAGFDALDHYKKYGRAEGRPLRP